MNFEQDDRGRMPRITGLPEEQFQTPANSQYWADSNSNYSQAEVNPFTPPEYRAVEVEPIAEADGENPETDERFAEQEIANWQAQDLLIAEKSKRWYALFSLVVVIFIGVAFLTGSWSFALLVIVSAVAVVVLRSSNHAKIISYSLSTRGIYMGEAFHAYDEFKSFGIVKERDIYSIVLMPKKRFSPSTTIYFNKDDGEKITDIIGSRLPMEEIHHDLIDKIIRKIKL